VLIISTFQHPLFRRFSISDHSCSTQSPIRIKAAGELRLAQQRPPKRARRGARLSSGHIPLSDASDSENLRYHASSTDTVMTNSPVLYQPVAGSGLGGKDSANQENGYRTRFLCVHCAWVQHLSLRKDSAGNFQWPIIVSAIHSEFGHISATYRGNMVCPLFSLRARIFRIDAPFKIRLLGNLQENSASYTLVQCRYAETYPSSGR
jgi:hypothetical protein